MKAKIFFNQQTQTLVLNCKNCNNDKFVSFPETSEAKHFYENLLIALFAVSNIFANDFVKKITIKKKKIEIDFLQTKKINLNQLKKDFVFSNKTFKKLNEKKLSDRKIEIFFENWQIKIDSPILKLNEATINSKILQKVSFQNYSTFKDNNDNLIQRIQLSCLDDEIFSVDHRTVNKSLNFFKFIEKIGLGLPIWLPNGEFVKNEIKNFIKKIEYKNKYFFVNTPIMADKKIYQTSGHLPHYEKYTFPSIKMKNEELMLRPMTCPQHCLIFKSEPRSYNFLPMRISENALLFRYESSGSLIGLERTRQMELKDTHIFVQKDNLKIKKEIQTCFEMTQKILKVLEINIEKIDLSLPDFNNKTKYYNDPKIWTETEALLIEILNEMNIKFNKIKGEASFYGPKIDFQIKNSLGHEITVSTIQLDFLLAERFKLKYRTKNQKKNESMATPVIIHHGIFGTYERIISILLENNKGWLPFWLAPTQVYLITTSNNLEIQKFTDKVFDLLNSCNIRTVKSNLVDKISKKVKYAWENKIPFQLFIGSEELKKNKITIIFYKNPKKKETLTIFQFIDKCQKLMNTN